MIVNLILLATFGQVVKWICCILGLICIVFFFLLRSGNKYHRQYRNQVNNSIVGQVVTAATGQEIMQDDSENKNLELILGVLSLAGATAILFWVIIPFWHILGWIVAGIFLVLYFVFRGSGKGCLAWVMLALAFFAVLTIFVPLSELF